MISLTIEVDGEARDVAFLADLAERYARHRDGDTVSPLIEVDGDDASRCESNLRQLSPAVTEDARWLLLTIGTETLAGRQPRGKALRQMYAEQHGRDLPNEGTLGAWVKSIRRGAKRLDLAEPFAVGYPDSPEAVYSMPEDIARAVVIVLAP